MIGSIYFGINLDQGFYFFIFFLFFYFFLFFFYFFYFLFFFFSFFSVSTQDRVGVLFFLVINQAFSMIVSLETFLNERTLFNRERSANSKKLKKKIKINSKK